MPEKRRRRSARTARSTPSLATTSVVATNGPAPFTHSPALAPVATTRRSQPAQAPGSTISVEALLWVLLIAATAWSRFWDLGYRTLHHDESLHVYYSWQFATGDIPYVHNPLMHGPFLFMANALMYLLFGQSNFTSRMLPALAGVLIVAAPLLLRSREFLGRWGALATGFMLFISPSYLYYTRFIRHDPYTALGSLLLCIAIFRYLQRPRRRWMIIAFVDVAILLANHEIIFAILLAFVAVLWGALQVTRLRALIAVHLAAGALAVVLLMARRVFSWEPLPTIPWRSPTPEATRLYYGALIRNPLVIGVLLLGVLFVAGCLWTIRHVARERAARVGYVEALFGDSQPGSVSYGVCHALRDAQGLVIGAIVSLGIFFGLFTTLFTNPQGFETATFAPDGTLLYWLGQQGERRGNQPWFYFITEGLQYEWLAIMLGAAGLILTGVLLGRRALHRGSSTNLLFPSFLSVWLVFMVLVLSWAGEKMPWLIMHIVLPASLLGGLVIKVVAEEAMAWFGARHRILSTAGVAAGLVVLTGSSFFLVSRFTFGRWTQITENLWERSVPQSTLDDWWALAVAPIVALILVGVAVVRLGIRPAAYGTLTAALIVMTVFQVHTGFFLSYLDGDGANDTMIYNTVGSDVTQLSNDLDAMSELMYGDSSMPVIYDNCTAWPLNWNLRDLPNREIRNTVTATDGNLPPVIIGVTKSMDGGCSMPDKIDGYTIQQYTFRWHEPEALIYRNFAIAPELTPGLSAWRSVTAPHGIGAIVESVWSSTTTLADPAGQQRVFRLLMFREMPGGVTRYRVNVYIRNDALAYYNDVRYGE